MCPPPPSIFCMGGQGEALKLLISGLLSASSDSALSPCCYATAVSAMLWAGEGEVGEAGEVGEEQMLNNCYINYENT